MSRVNSKDTLEELRVRRIAHSMGLRYQRHRRERPVGDRFRIPEAPCSCIRTWIFLASSPGLQEGHDSQVARPVLAGKGGSGADSQGNCSIYRDRWRS